MGYPSVTLPLDRWPALDRERWEKAIRVGDVFEPAGAAAYWSEKTRRQVLKDVGRLLFWLQENDDLDAEQRLGARLTRARLEAYVKHLESRGMASTSLLSRMRGLRQGVAALDPGADAALLKTVCNRLKARAAPTRQKHLRLIPPAVIIDKALALYDRLAGTGRPMPIRACTDARDALKLAFLVYHPLRLANFADLQFGTSLLTVGSGYRIAHRGEVTKEGRPYESGVTDELVPYLQHYCAVVRPALLDGEASGHLWVSMRGGALSESAIYYQIMKITRRLLGVAINPHTVRDCVLTAIAEQAPQNVRLGGRLLGHLDPRTGEQHYNHAGPPTVSWVQTAADSAAAPNRRKRIA